MSTKIERIPYQTSIETDLLRRYRLLLQRLTNEYKIDECFKIHTKKISLNSLIEFLVSLYDDNELISMAINNRESRLKGDKKERKMMNTTFKPLVYSRVKKIGAISMVSENNMIEAIMKAYKDDELVQLLLDKKKIEKINELR